MPSNFNPFQPNSPVSTGVFAGREKEINDIDKALLQTRGGNPTHLIITGERGIGKTSLMLLANVLASNPKLKGHNFLTAQVVLTDKIRMADLAIQLKKIIERKLANISPEISLIKKFWGFVTKIEYAGIGIKQEGQQKDKGENEIMDDFIFSLVDTVRGLTQESVATDLGLSEKKDGLVILIDEADKASEELDLGVLLKKLSETLISEGCNNILFILVGLPVIRDVLKNSHESSLRLFKELYLNPLVKKDVEQVVKDGIRKSNEMNKGDLTVNQEALDGVYVYSEGYPHFVQQIGHSVFDYNTDNLIDGDDVRFSFFGDNGALTQIGGRYFKKSYYEDINTNTQREVLDIMAENWNGWTSREHILKKYSKGEKNLNNAIKALREKNIILSKEGERGQYRLQWGSFAFWIGMQSKNKPKKE